MPILFSRSSRVLHHGGPGARISSGQSKRFVYNGLTALYIPWFGDQGDIQVIDDFSGLARHAQNGSLPTADTNDAAWVVDEGLSFDGVDDYLIPPEAAHNFSGDRSITLILDGSTVGNKVILGAYDTGSPFSGWGVRVGSDSKLAVFTDTDGSWRKSTSVLPSGWHAWTVTMDASNARFYLNGVLDATVVSAHPSAWSTAKIGSAVAPGAFFDKNIALLAIHNRKLTPEEAGYCYQMGARHFPQGF